MTTSAHTIYEWMQPNFRAVNKFYKKQKHKGSASGEERVFVVIETHVSDLTDTEQADNNIIAAVRLVSSQGYYWLRSLYVDQNLRGQQIGSKLLNYVNNHIDQDIHCFPYTHLQHFYQQSGYELTPVTDAPLPLQQLYERYNRKGDSILFMSHLA